MLPFVSTASRPPLAVVVVFCSLKTCWAVPPAAFGFAVAAAAVAVVGTLSVLVVRFGGVVAGPACPAGALITDFAPFDALSGIFPVGAFSAITGTCARRSA